MKNEEEKRIATALGLIWVGGWTIPGRMLPVPAPEKNWGDVYVPVLHGVGVGITVTVGVFNTETGDTWDSRLPMTGIVPVPVPVAAVVVQPPIEDFARLAQEYWAKEGYMPCPLADMISVWKSENGVK